MPVSTDAARLLALLDRVKTLDPQLAAELSAEVSAWLTRLSEAAALHRHAALAHQLAAVGSQLDCLDARQRLDRLRAAVGVPGQN